MKKIRLESAHIPNQDTITISKNCEGIKTKHVKGSILTSTHKITIVYAQGDREISELEFDGSVAQC